MNTLVKTFVALSSLFQFGTVHGLTETVLLVSEAVGSSGSDTIRFLDFSYPQEAVDFFNDPNYYVYGYELIYGNGDYIVFDFVDSTFDDLVLGDGNGLGPSTLINILDTNIGQFIGDDEAFWCKQCTTTNNNNYGDTCWGILPTTDNNRICGCNSGSWTGEGLYYGGYNPGQCNICACWGGGFAGYRVNRQQKGAINSVGFNLSILFKRDTDEPSNQPTEEPQDLPPL